MESVCKNCKATISSTQKFCGECSQKTSLHRITLHEFLHETIHAFTHADTGIFHLVKELALNPGRVLREFIIDFKRKKYFNPFTFLLIVTGIAVVVTLYFKPYSHNKKSDAQIEQEGKAKNLRAIEIRMAKNNARMNEFLDRNVKLILFASIPCSAFIFFLFYRKTGLNFAEHLVACLFITGFLSLVMTAFTPLQAMVKNGRDFMLVTLPTLVFQWVFFAQSYFGFTKEFGTTKVRAYIASFVNIIAWSIFTMLIFGLIFFT